MLNLHYSWCFYFSLIVDNKNEKSFLDTECCKSFKLLSSGPASISQNYAFGTYVINTTISGTSSHNAHVYKKIDDEIQHFMYHFQSLNLWFIGPEPGKNFGYLVHTNGYAKCPENLDNESWFYMGKNKQWKPDDDTIVIRCN